MASKGNRKILDGLVNEAVEHFSASGRTPAFIKTRFEKMIYHVMPDHPYANTASTVTSIYKCLVPEATMEQINQAETLGWIWQMFQDCYIMFDDMIDQDETRFGRASWFAVNNYRVSSVSFDFILLNSTIFYLLEKHFGHMGFRYIQMVRACHQALMESTQGNSIETIVSIRHGQEYESLEAKAFAKKFGLSEWELIAEQKFCMHIKLPILLAIILAGIRSEEKPDIIRGVTEVARKIVRMCALLDDYFDIFTLNKNNDTKYTDARRGQLSFLWVATKQLCKDPEEWKQFLNRYGRNDPECFAWVKGFITRIGVPEMFQTYKANLYKEIHDAIQDNFGDQKNVAAGLQWSVDFLHKSALDELGHLNEKMDL